VDGIEDEVEALLLFSCWFGKNFDFGEPFYIVYENFYNEILEKCSSCFCDFKNLLLTQFGVSM